MQILSVPFFNFCQKAVMNFIDIKNLLLGLFTAEPGFSTYLGETRPTYDTTRPYYKYQIDSLDAMEYNEMFVRQSDGTLAWMDDRQYAWSFPEGLKAATFTDATFIVKDCNNKS
jgi:hypothetical protein